MNSIKAKRFTDWPQAILGVTFNWGKFFKSLTFSYFIIHLLFPNQYTGVLLGWSGVICSSSEVQSLNLLAFLPAFVLYTGCINWTLFYDTIYAFQDKEHDEKMGLKSTAILLQKNPTLWLLGFSTLCSSNLALFGWLTSQEPIYYITVGAAMLHFLKQIIMVDYKSPKSCMSQFKSNTAIGYLVAFGLLASIYIK
jgi:4-hydroxybenzoate polyprenyltransferase